MIKRLLCLLVLAFFVSGASAHSDDGPSVAHYMANEGLMVVHGETKVVFDPLFRSGFGHYQLLPKPMEEALFAGAPPYDGIDAVFISHYHGDHFSPEDVLRLLKVQPDIRLYAPVQAVEGLRSVSESGDEAIFERVIAVDLAYKDAPISLEMDGIEIGAVRIPHSGWPTGRLDVENISWRVTLDKTTTVLHMGDADPNDIHFERDAVYWDKRVTNMAFPPYWFFDSTEGPDVLKTFIKAEHNVGIHVPIAIPTNPANRPPGLRKHDLFTQPGESREIPEG
jgi:glyoxylase-like metal-dependent hydrolase (beta-lactamase superfamily II)